MTRTSDRLMWWPARLPSPPTTGPNSPTRPGGGEPLVCLPGGAMRASEYLGDLGGLTAGRRLVLLDLRGTGGSAIPADESTYRVDHQVADVEAPGAPGAGARGPPRTLLRRRQPGPALRGRPSGTDTPDGPSPRPPGRWTFRSPRRTGWRAPGCVRAASRTTPPSRPTGGSSRPPVTAPTRTGTWPRRCSTGAGTRRRGRVARRTRGSRTRRRRRHYAGAGAFDPAATRAGLRRVGGEDLVLAAELDGNPRPALAERLAALFPRGVVDVQPRACHFPWLDGPAWFAGRVERLLSGDLAGGGRSRGQAAGPPPPDPRASIAGGAGSASAGWGVPAGVKDRGSAPDPAPQSPAGLSWFRRGWAGAGGAGSASAGLGWPRRVVATGWRLLLWLLIWPSGSPPCRSGSVGWRG